MAIEVDKLHVYSMPGAIGLVQYGQFKSVDKNGDGSHDLYRISNFRIWLREDIGVAGQWTAVMAHELGHVMGLDNCAQCNQGTSVMSVSEWLPGPTACDNGRIATFQN